MPPVKHYSSSELNQHELSTRLLSLTQDNTSYTLTQINGQRIYKKAPHAWNGPEPLRSCEVFIGRIPHDCFEDTLVPLFRQAGELFEFRLMINFSGWNRGYAFAMYTAEAEAANAIRMFNNYMIRPSWQLGVCPSINNCRIFISRIPASTASAEIVRLVYALTDDVAEVRVRRAAAWCAAIVEYRSHRAAAMARKALLAAAAAAWGSGARPAVDWSLPHTPHLFRQYREVGRWSRERGVELWRVEESAVPAPPPHSYTLEPGSQARRLRMIHHAQRAAAHQWSALRNMDSICSSLSSLALTSGLESGPDSALGVGLDYGLGSRPDSGLDFGMGLRQDSGLDFGLGSRPDSGFSSRLGAGLGPAELAVWSPPGAEQLPPQVPEYNPWTAVQPFKDLLPHYATSSCE